MEESFGSFINQNVGLLKEYIDVRLDLIRLQAVRLSSRVLSTLVMAFILVMLSLFILFFLGLTFSAWISMLTGSQIAGYASTAALFLLLLLLIIALRKPLLQSPMIRLFIHETMHAAEEESSKNDAV